MFRYLMIAVVSFCLGGLVFGGYETWLEYENQKKLEAERIGAEKRHRVRVLQQEKAKLEAAERQKLLNAKKLEKETGTIVQENLDGFKDLRFDMTMDQLRAKRLTCHMVFHKGNCSVPRSIGLKTSRYEQTAFGQSVDDLRIKLENTWGPVTTADFISYAVALPVSQSKELLVKNYGKPFLFDEKNIGSGYNKSIWVFKNGGALILHNSDGARSKLFYLSPRHFANAYGRFVQRFKLEDLFDPELGLMKFDGSDL